MPSPRLRGKLSSEDVAGLTRSDTLIPSEDWTQISDKAERRRVQNRISQRKYRQKMKKRMQTNETDLTPPTPDETSRQSRRSPRHAKDEDTHSVEQDGDSQTMPSPVHDYINEHDLPPPGDASLYTPWTQHGTHERLSAAHSMLWPSGGTNLIYFEPSPVDWGPLAATASSMTPITNETYLQPSTPSPWWIKTGSYVSCTELSGHDELEYPPPDDETSPRVDTLYVCGHDIYSPDQGGRHPGAA